MRLVTALALGTVLLSGCGLSTPLATQGARTATAQDYNMTFDEARHIADRTRYAYDDLRYKSNMTPDLAGKDRLEEEMVAVVVKGLESIRSLVRNNPDPSCRWTFDKVDGVLKAYSSLQVQFAMTDDKAKRRSIVTKMQYVVLEGLELRSVVAR